MAIVKPPELPSEAAATYGPAKHLSLYNREIRGASHVNDHEDHQIRIVWHPKEPYKKWGTVPPFPYQVYLTKNARKCLEDELFQEKFAAYIDNLLGKYPDCQYRLEIYQQPFANVLACVAHQRREVEWRYRNGVWPQIIRRWDTDRHTGYIGKILIIDTDRWEKEGIDFVSFDPIEYEHPEKFDGWRLAGVGDVAAVRGYRLAIGSHIERWLSEWWRDAGFKWTEADLERRNNGGYSPALYPAVDPDLHRDVEDDDSVQDLSNALTSLTVGEDKEDDGPPKIWHRWDIKRLYWHSSSFANYMKEYYSDTFRRRVVSVWDRSLSKLRPYYSFTLYLSSDLAPMWPEAIFDALNLGLIAFVPWTLDIVYNMGPMEEALEYHTRSSRQRTLAKTKFRRRCMNMVVRKVTDKRLPDELQESIVDILSPPAIPGYSSRPSRPFDIFLMYLDAKSLSIGPQLIYSDPKPYWNQHTPSELMHILAPNNESNWPSACAEMNFETRNLRFWNRVADELHIVWSMTSPPAPMPENIPLPHMKTKLIIPEIWTPSTFADFENPKVMVNMDLQSTLPIVIQHSTPCSHTLCGDAHEIVDLEIGEVLPQLPYRPAGINSFLNGWWQSPTLGLTGTRDNLVTTKAQLVSRRSPGPSGEGPLSSSDWWWNVTVDMNRKLGSWVDGREYALRLKAGVTLPRWTFDTRDHNLGPYNYPGIPIAMNEIRFTWRDDESDNAT